MSSPISPFDISLIVELIGSYLCRKDFANCVLINRTCYSQFTRLYWRKLKIIQDQDHDTLLPIPFDSEDQKSLRANSYHTRYLTIVESGDANILRFLAHPSSICNSLVEFDCTHKGSIFSPTLLSLVMDLVDGNTAMRKLSLLGFTGNNTNDYCERLFRSLSTHRSLTTLRLLDPPEVHPVAYRGLLRHLPPNLENLVLRWCVKNIKERKEPHHRSLRQLYPQLRSLALSLEVHEQERTTIIPFLLKCPNLESIEVLNDWEGTFDSIVSVLRKENLHPNLKAITLGALHKFRDWERLGKALQSRIRSVSLYDFDNSAFIWHILPHWAETIEFIRIQSMALQGRGIVQIMTTCPNLRTFSMFTTLPPLSTQMTPPISQYGLPTMLHDDSPAQEIEWVCLDLENLEITYSDSRIVAEGSTPESLLRQEERTAKGIKKAYQQIGRLGKLQHLRIGWRTTNYFINDANLNLSFSSGLRNLRGLKELKVLDISCLPRVKIDSEEVEWIAENWPELNLIKGYFTKDRRDIGSMNGMADNFEKLDEEIIDAKWNGFKDPPYIEWLRCLRPEIIIT